MRSMPAPGASRVPAWQSLASLRPSMNAGPRPSIAAVAPMPLIHMGGLAEEVRATACDASAKLRNIDKYCDRAEHEAALQLADELIAQDDGNADAHAARAYVLFKQHVRDEAGLPREVADSLRAALGIDPDNCRALLTKGLVYKAGGDLKKALGYFRRASQLDRRNLEAKRELRLARMRLDE
jgi:Tfp pilus assembly protein PilF